jgi:hypothetical protein
MNWWLSPPEQAYLDKQVCAHQNLSSSEQQEPGWLSILSILKKEVEVQLTPALSSNACMNPVR